MNSSIVAMSPLLHVLTAIVLSGGAIVISWPQAATLPRLPGSLSGLTLLWQIHSCGGCVLIHVRQ